MPVGEEVKRQRANARNVNFVIESESNDYGLSLETASS